MACSALPHSIIALHINKTVVLHLRYSRVVLQQYPCMLSLASAIRSWTTCRNLVTESFVHSGAVSTYSSFKLLLILISPTVYAVKDVVSTNQPARQVCPLRILALTLLTDERDSPSKPEGPRHVIDCCVRAMCPSQQVCLGVNAQPQVFVELRATLRGRLLGAKHPDVCGGSSLPQRVQASEVRTFAGATREAQSTYAHPQPPAVDSSKPDDEAAIAGFIASTQKCSSVEQLQQLVCSILGLPCGVSQRGVYLQPVSAVLQNLSAIMRAGER